MTEESDSTFEELYAQIRKEVREANLLLEKLGLIDSYGNWIP